MKSVAVNITRMYIYKIFTYVFTIIKKKTFLRLFDPLFVCNFSKFLIIEIYYININVVSLFLSDVQMINRREILQFLIHYSRFLTVKSAIKRQSHQGSVRSRLWQSEYSYFMCSVPLQSCSPFSLFHSFRRRFVSSWLILNSRAHTISFGRAMHT